MPRFRWAAALLLPIFLSACNTLPDHLREDIQEKRLADTGVEELDPSGESPSAGISILRNLDIPPMDPKRIGADTSSAGFQRYVHRCGTCHATSDPSLRTGPEWPYVFPRMTKHMEEAGLTPLGPTDKALILGFLEKHAASR